jgi:hypothetical protein
MKKTIVNVETGQQITVDLTPKEIAEDLAQQAIIEAEQNAFVPAKVPMWAVRTVLQNNNLFSQAENLVLNSNDNALKNIWEYGNDAYRNSAAINSLGSSLGLSDEQLDQMFRDAFNLSV